jgi:hypothetical protein
MGFKPPVTIAEAGATIALSRSVEVWMASADEFAGGCTNGGCQVSNGLDGSAPVSVQRMSLQIKGELSETRRDFVVLFQEAP